MSFVSEPNPDIYLNDNFLVLDFETTNIEYGTALEAKNHLLLACWRWRGECKSTWGDEFGQDKLLNDLSKADFIIAHNSKFELSWLKRCGMNLRDVLPYCTMIGEKVIAGNRKFALSLDATAARYGVGGKSSVVSALIAAGVCPSEIPRKLLEDYCANDVAITEAVFLKQREVIKEMGLLPVAYCRNIVTPCLADIEFNGMYLDTKRVVETYESYAKQYASVANEFSAATGGINPRSTKQMREFIYEKLSFEETTDYRGNPKLTGKGARPTDKHTIAALKANTPKQKTFKKLASELATLKVPMQNLKKMMAKLKESPDDPRVFAIYNQTVTQTDRLSSSGRRGGFQFHNFDRAFKRLFRARKGGWVICEADAPQLEFRVAAYLGNDAVAIRDICEGLDVHQATADTLGVSRQSAKAFTFRPLYGGSSGTKRERDYFDYFRKRYASLYRRQTQWTMGVARDKFLKTATGLRFYWPHAEIQVSGYVPGTTQIFNYPIQSLATADIIPLVVASLWHKLRDFDNDVFLVNTIHDSVVLEINPTRLDSIVDIIVDCFTNTIYDTLKELYGLEFTVPLGVGIKSGPFWGDGKELKYDPGISRVRTQALRDTDGKRRRKT